MSVIDGFVSPEHPLSPRTAFGRLKPLVQGLTNYEALPLWEQDTLTLPPALQTYRRRMRRFAEQHLRPQALDSDRDPYDDGAQRVLVAAARDGLLTDFLPTPIGSIPWRMLPFSLAWQHALKMEELAAECGGLGLLIGANALGVMPLLLSGDWSVLKRFLLPMAKRNRAGTPSLMAFAITEPSGGSDVEESHGGESYVPRTMAKRVDGGWKLSGRKVFISGGNLADAVTVFAATERSLSSWTCFVVERGMPGFEVVRNELKMGQRASAASELLFDEVFVPETHCVGEVGSGWALNRATLNISRAPVGAIALGIARGAMQNAIHFACQTSLGRKRLIDYQRVQLQISQMIIDTSAMRALLWQTARHWRATQARAAIAKVFCSDTAMKVCETAMSLMGDQGYRHSQRVEKAYRDARLTQIYEGTNQINRLAIIEDFLDEFSGDQRW